MQETMIKLCDDGDTAQQGKGDAKRVEEEGIDYVEIENVEVITMEDSFDFQNEQTDSGITTTKDNHDMVSDNNNVLLVKSTRTQNPEGRWGRWVRDKGPPLLICDHRGLAIASAASAAAPGVTLLSHPFGPGLGCLYVAPDLISTATHKEITQEIRSLGGRERFRIYPIQGEWEPRTHFFYCTRRPTWTPTPEAELTRFLIQQRLNQATAMDVVREASRPGPSTIPPLWQSWRGLLRRWPVTMTSPAPRQPVPWKRTGILVPMLYVTGMVVTISAYMQTMIKART
jgi:hypothetical protein